MIVATQILDNIIGNGVKERLEDSDFLSIKSSTTFVVFET
jgi:hypothetical protein